MNERFFVYVNFVSLGAIFWAHREGARLRAYFKTMSFMPIARLNYFKIGALRILSNPNVVCIVYITFEGVSLAPQN